MKKISNIYKNKLDNPFSFEKTTGETKLRQDNPIYAAMIENLDDNFGRIIKILKEYNLYKNTIIVFTSDRGLSNELIKDLLLLLIFLLEQEKVTTMKAELKYLFF